MAGENEKNFFSNWSENFNNWMHSIYTNIEPTVRNHAVYWVVFLCDFKIQDYCKDFSTAILKNLQDPRFLYHEYYTQERFTDYLNHKKILENNIFNEERLQSKAYLENIPSPVITYFELLETIHHIEKVFSELDHIEINDQKSVEAILTDLAAWGSKNLPILANRIQKLSHASAEIQELVAPLIYEIQTKLNQAYEYQSQTILYKDTFIDSNQNKLEKLYYKQADITEYVSRSIALSSNIFRELLEFISEGDLIIDFDPENIAITEQEIKLNKEFEKLKNIHSIKNSTALQGLINIIYKLRQESMSILNEVQAKNAQIKENIEKKLWILENQTLAELYSEIEQLEFNLGLEHGILATKFEENVQKHLASFKAKIDENLTALPQKSKDLQVFLEKPISSTLFSGVTNFAKRVTTVPKNILSYVSPKKEKPISMTFSSDIQPRFTYQLKEVTPNNNKDPHIIEIQSQQEGLFFNLFRPDSHEVIRAIIPWKDLSIESPFPTTRELLKDQTLLPQLLEYATENDFLPESYEQLILNARFERYQTAKREEEHYNELEKNTEHFFNLLTRQDGYALIMESLTDSEKRELKKAYLYIQSYIAHKYPQFDIYFVQMMNAEPEEANNAIIQTIHSIGQLPSYFPILRDFVAPVLWGVYQTAKMIRNNILTQENLNQMLQNKNEILLDLKQHQTNAKCKQNKIKSDFENRGQIEIFESYLLKKTMPILRPMSLQSESELKNNVIEYEIINDRLKYRLRLPGEKENIHGEIPWSKIIAETSLTDESIQANQHLILPAILRYRTQQSIEIKQNELMVPLGEQFENKTLFGKIKELKHSETIANIEKKLHTQLQKNLFDSEVLFPAYQLAFMPMDTKNKPLAGIIELRQTRYRLEYRYLDYQGNLVNGSLLWSLEKDMPQDVHAILADSEQWLPYIYNKVVKKPGPPFTLLNTDTDEVITYKKLLNAVHNLKTCLSQIENAADSEDARVLKMPYKILAGYQFVWPIIKDGLFAYFDAVEVIEKINPALMPIIEEGISYLESIGETIPAIKEYLKQNPNNQVNDSSTLPENSFVLWRQLQDSYFQKRYGNAPFVMPQVESSLPAESINGSAIKPELHVKINDSRPGSPNSSSEKNEPLINILTKVLQAKIALHSQYQALTMNLQEGLNIRNSDTSIIQEEITPLTVKQELNDFFNEIHTHKSVKTDNESILILDILRNFILEEQTPISYMQYFNKLGQTLNVLSNFGNILKEIYKDKEPQLQENLQMIYDIVGYRILIHADRLESEGGLIPGSISSPLLGNLDHCFNTIIDNCLSQDIQSHIFQFTHQNTLFELRKAQQREHLEKLQQHKKEIQHESMDDKNRMDQALVILTTLSKKYENYNETNWANLSSMPDDLLADFKQLLNQYDILYPALKIDPQFVKGSFLYDLHPPKTIKDGINTILSHQHLIDTYHLGKITKIEKQIDHQLALIEYTKTKQVEERSHKFILHLLHQHSVHNDESQGVEKMAKTIFMNTVPPNHPRIIELAQQLRMLPAHELEEQIQHFLVELEKQFTESRSTWPEALQHGYHSLCTIEEKIHQMNKIERKNYNHPQMMLYDEHFILLQKTYRTQLKQFNHYLSSYITSSSSNLTQYQDFLTTETWNDATSLAYKKSIRALDILEKVAKTNLINKDIKKDIENIQRGLTVNKNETLSIHNRWGNAQEKIHSLVSKIQEQVENPKSYGFLKTHAHQENSKEKLLSELRSCLSPNKKTDKHFNSTNIILDSLHRTHAKKTPEFTHKHQPNVPIESIISKPALIQDISVKNLPESASSVTEIDDMDKENEIPTHKSNF